MLMHRTGSRFDNQEWPGYLGTIDVPDWEAEDLVRNGLAEYPGNPSLNRGYDVLKTADPDFESKLERLDGEQEEEMVSQFEVEDFPDDFDSDFDRDDSASEVTESTMKRPSTAEPKAKWIEWAVHNGANGNTAAEWTKAALIKEYSSL
jgi:hypothetical protein